jgi:hypothetical protein
VHVTAVIGFRLRSGRLRLRFARAFGARLTDREPDASASVRPAGNRVTSGPGPPVFVRSFNSDPIPVRWNFVLGNAKLLPQVVHVKRETL